MPCAPWGIHPRAHAGHLAGITHDFLQKSRAGKSRVLLEGWGQRGRGNPKIQGLPHTHAAWGREAAGTGRAAWFERGALRVS